MALSEIQFARVFGTTAFRLAAITISGFVVAAAAILAFLVVQTNRAVTEQVLAEIRAEADLLRATAANGGPDALREAIELRSMPPARGLYRLSGPGGQRIAGNLTRIPPEIDPASGGTFRYAPPDIGGTGERLRLAAAVAETSGAWQLIVARDVDDQIAFASRIRRIFLWGFGLLSLAALLGGLAAGRQMLRRVEAISATSRSIMAGQLSRRMTVTGEGDEFDELAVSLNAMLDRIEQLMASLREVSDNIAHDLKTPLNRLRNRAEAALRESRGGAEHREALERIIEESDGLISTFNALLLIARLEAGARDDTAASFDVAALVQDVAELYEPVAEEAGTSLQVESGRDVAIKANRHLIGQAVANLIDNAIKYGTRAAGPDPAADVTIEPGHPSARHTDEPIAIRVAARDGTVEITVADRGPGIGEKDRARALKRFVRLEESRTRPGTGLGLSLVAAVARLHGGQVRLEDNAPGLRVVLALPV